MSSPSTHRRARKDAALLIEWSGTVVGQRVTVARDNGETLKTVMTTAPFSLDGNGAYVVVEGIPGNTHLRRVTKGWNP